MQKKWNKILILVLMTLVVLLPTNSINAATKLSLYNYNTKKHVSYTGQQVKYTYDGDLINDSTIPGIIENGTALGSYYEIFATSPLKVSTKYDKAKGTVTLKKNGNTVVVKIGSKTATVNGKSVTMDVAPMKVQYKSVKLTRVLVPTRFVTENLGYTYTWTSSNSTAAITSPFQIRYNNKTINYTGTLGKVTVDGKNIGLGHMPGIIIDNTAMLRAKQVFASSSIGAKYTYNNKTKEVTLTKDSNTVVFTLGSKTAYVNGNVKTLDTAPIAVSNVAKNLNYVMVPGSFTASALGYDYQWSSSNKTSVITTRKEIEEPIIDDSVVVDGPELGDEAVADGLVINWAADSKYNDTIQKLSTLEQVKEVAGPGTNIGYIYNVERDYSVTDKEVFMIRSTEEFSNSTVLLKEKELNITVKNAVGMTTDYSVVSNFVNGLSSVVNNSTATTDVVFKLNNPGVLYDISLSEDKKIMYVSLYNNYITRITAGISGGDNFIEFTAVAPFDMTLTDEDGLYFIHMNNMVNAIGDKNIATSNLDSFKNIETITVGENIMYINLNKQTESEYTIKKDGNKQRITFHVEKDEVPDVSVDVDYAATIPLPDGISYSEVEVEDRYYNKQIVLKVPGNYTSFYKNVNNYKSSSVISKISTTYTKGYTEVIILTTRIQGYRMEEANGSILVELGNPKDMYDRIVILDAGHGGTDPGAIYKLNGKQIYEKTINQQILARTEKYFNAEDSSIKVYYSIVNDKFLTLYQRAGLAAQVGADLFISLHQNANTNTSPNGTEIYYSSTNKAAMSGLTSKQLASLVLKELPKAAETATRYVHDKNYVVIKQNTVPSILIELGFMSNQSDFKKITNATTQEKVAKSLYDILESIFDTYPAKR